MDSQAETMSLQLGPDFSFVADRAWSGSGSEAGGCDDKGQADKKSSDNNSAAG